MTEFTSSPNMLYSSKNTAQFNSQDVKYHLDHLSGLDIDSEPAKQRLTGIICTIGPASRDVNILVDLIKAGMTIVRLNFSHGDHEYHAGTIANARQAIKKAGKELGVDDLGIAIALDTKGPEIRTGMLADDAKEVEIKKKSRVTVTTDDKMNKKCSAELVYVDYKNITKVLSVGNRIYIDDGLISLQVNEVHDTHLLCEAENTGLLGSKKGVNLPGAAVDLPAVSEKDKEDLEFGVKQKVDMIFASFVRNARGVEEIRKVLGEDGKHIAIISKIENHEGVRKADEIIDASDGVMVARGDMGIEIPVKKVFVAQKMIIAKCNEVGKPVICATQMLESMTKNPRPTRAEITDVGNAVVDGADCVMLSGESAKGHYPMQTVKMMSDICLEAEAVIWSQKQFHNIIVKAQWPAKITTCIAMQAVFGSLMMMAAAIIVISPKEEVAHLVSKFRPRCPIIAFFNCRQAMRQARLFRGVLPLFYDDERVDSRETEEAFVRVAIDFGRKREFLQAEHKVVVVSGSDEHPAYRTKVIEID